MLTTRLVLLTALAATLAGAPSDAHAQTPTRADPWRSTTTRAGEALYTVYRLGRGARASADAVGGRLMWSPPAAAPLGPLASRTSVGVFAAHAPRKDGRNFSALHLGGQADVRPLAAPILGRLDPVLSLGAGALRTNVAAARPSAAGRVPLAAESNTAFALSPGVGARFDLGAGLGLRAEVGDVITFRRDARHNVAVGAGLSFTF